ncbi:MAG: DsrE family protein [Acidiferrobacter sp.]
MALNKAKILKALFATLLPAVFMLQSSSAFASTRPPLTRSRNGHSLAYYKHRTFKAVFEVPGNPKLWPAVALVLTHNIASLIGHGIRTKIILVAPGPTIHFFMAKYDAANYKKLVALRRLGVRMLACHAALVAFHVSEKQLFPFVGVAYPNGVTYLLKKQAQGYPYYVWP